MSKSLNPFKFVLGCLIVILVNKYLLTGATFLVVGVIGLIIVFSKIQLQFKKSWVLLIFSILFCYLLLQGLIVNDEIIRYIQPLALVILYFIFYNSCLSIPIRTTTLDISSKYLSWLILFLLFPFVVWGDGRISGMLGNPNATAFFAIFVFPLTLFSKQRNLKLTLIFLFITLILTASRGAMLAIILSISYSVIVYRLKISSFFLHLLCVLIIFLISLYILDVFSFVVQILPTDGIDSHLFDTTSSGRVDIVDMAMKDFYKNPIIGNGFSVGTYELQENVILKSHNGYVDILTRQGIMGMVIFIAILLAFINDICSIRSPRLRSIGVIPVAILVSISTNDSIYLSLNFFFFITLLTIGLSKQIDEYESATYNK